MRLSDYFDRTFVLNLPDRADRRREVGRVLERAGMPWEPGRVELFPATRPDSAGPFPSVGARGAFLSHLAMLRRASELVLSRSPGHLDGGPMHVDGAFSTFRAQSADVVTLVASPSLGWQRSSRSDIAANRWFDHLPVSRRLVGLARRLVGRVRKPRA